MKKRIKKKTSVSHDWEQLNKRLMKLSKSEPCEALLKAELAGPRRVRYVLRIHSRLNRLRALEERTRLTKK